ncbi:MAG: helix-turn-helix domain-containing protein [Phaeodactylibacter sp.]|nr:helix-turn-helix domain-containing protein [Phaeodactylibacter sp.]MCB9275438.1 helix-turn-helix domain-containing protein [Lewinellaceae bacterium]
MKAILEKIEPVFGNSFTLRRFDSSPECNRPSWHFHPEYEIVYISNGRGKRHIGDHVSYFEDGDLIFLGPNLPHFGFTEELYEEHTEIVVQMKEDFLGEAFLQKPEMAEIQQLFQRSRQGLSFSGPIHRQVGEKLEEMMEMGHFERLLALLSILQELAQSADYEMFNANGFAIEVSAQDQDRMEAVFGYVGDNFQQEVSLDDAARQVNMTVPAFCRYFKKLTRKTFSQFVNEFRIAHACRLLADDNLTIAGVSFESGFNNLSHFNRQFKNITGLSPREYRKNIKKVVS